MNDLYRLSQIETMWSIVNKAHTDDEDTAQNAKREMINRYGGAVQRYFLGSLENTEAAEGAYQDFVVRVLSDRYRAADPQHGRFRDYLKRSLSNMVTDYHRAQKREGKQRTLDPMHEPVVDATFDTSWRDGLLQRAWDSLEQLERSSDKRHFTVLMVRHDYPDLKGPALADKLSVALSKQITPGNVRVLVHRAREVFSQLLLADVVHTLCEKNPEAIEEELADLGLLELCRGPLAQYRVEFASLS